MSEGALLCDTGALLDYLVASATDHRAFREAILQRVTWGSFPLSGSVAPGH